MKFLKSLLSLPLCVIVISFTLTGCYEDFINIFIEFTPGVYNQAKSEIVFYHFISAGKPPKGISRFPDGGTHEILFKEVTLYRYNIGTGKLYSVSRFGNIPSNAGSWREDISWQNGKIAFCLSPVSSWEWMMAHSSNPRYQSLHQTCSGIFIYDLETDSVTRISRQGIEPALSPDANRLAYLVSDSTKTDLWKMDLVSGDNQQIAVISQTDDYPPDLFWKDEQQIWVVSGRINRLFNIEKASFTEYNKETEIDLREVQQGEVIQMTGKITFKEWGFDLSTVWPRKQKEYINDIIRLHGNFNYRKAIIEEIGHDLKVKDIEKIMSQMMDYQNRLDGVDKMNYEIFSEETIDLLMELMKRKKDDI